MGTLYCFVVRGRREAVLLVLVDAVGDGFAVADHCAERRVGWSDVRDDITYILFDTDLIMSVDITTYK